LQVPLDVARRHPTRVQRENLVIKAVKARLPFGHNQRLKGRVAVARDFEREFTEVAFERLLGRAVAGVAGVLPGRLVLLVAEMVGQLSLHGTL